MRHMSGTRAGAWIVGLALLVSTAAACGVSEPEATAAIAETGGAGAGRRDALDDT